MNTPRMNLCPKPRRFRRFRSTRITLVGILLLGHAGCGFVGGYVGQRIGGSLFQNVAGQVAGKVVGQAVGRHLQAQLTSSAKGQDEVFVCNSRQDFNGNNLVDPGEFVGCKSRFSTRELVTVGAQFRNAIGHTGRVDLFDGAGVLKDRSNFAIRTAPCFAWRTFAAGALPTGTYTAQWWIDDRPFGAISFEVTIE